MAGPYYFHLKVTYQLTSSIGYWVRTYLELRADHPVGSRGGIIKYVNVDANSPGTISGTLDVVHGPFAKGDHFCFHVFGYGLQGISTTYGTSGGWARIVFV